MAVPLPRIRALNCESFVLPLGEPATVEARFFEASEPGGPPILIMPAMGVRASFYHGISEAFAQAGHSVLLADLRGIGGSNLRAKTGDDFGYGDIVLEDIPRLVAEARRRTGERPILFGHSLGGQLGCVFAGQNPDALAGIALIASCSVWYKNWPRRARAGLYAFYLFSAGVARVRGYWPGPRFGFGGYEAKTLVADWAAQGLGGDYTATGVEADLDSDMRRVQLPILAINLSDDSWAPMRATQHLLAKMPQARVSRILVQPAEVGLDEVKHFGWRKRHDFFADRVTSWIAEACSA